MYILEIIPFEIIQHLLRIISKRKSRSNIYEMIVLRKDCYSDARHVKKITKLKNQVTIPY